MFVTRASKKVYFNKFSNKDMQYNIEEYIMKILIFIISQIFFYYINNKKQFHDAYKNKSSKNENKIKFKNDVIVEFVFIFYYILINKMGEKLIYRKYYKKSALNNLLYTHFKSKSCRRKIIKLEELSKNIKLTHKLILTKKSFVIKKLKLIKSIRFFTSSNEISFHF